MKRSHRRLRENKVLTSFTFPELGTDDSFYVSFISDNEGKIESDSFVIQKGNLEGVADKLEDLFFAKNLPDLIKEVKNV